MAGLAGTAIIFVVLWATVAHAATVDITITTSGFSPSSVTIYPGDTVRWTNSSGAVANVSSNDHPTHTLYSSLNLGDFAPGEVKQLSFTTSTPPGSYGYHNHLDPAKTGWVYISSGPPPMPSSLVATAVSSSQVNLTWTDNATNETHQNIEREVSGSATWSTLTSLGSNITSYSDTTVVAGTSYNYRVQSCLSGSGCSSYTYSNTVTVPSVGDTTPPTAPQNLSATPVSSSRIDLSWGASTDNVSVANYKIYRNGAFWYQTSLLSYSDTGLTGNTTYSYYIKAVDAAGNVSASSNTVSSTTPSGTASCDGLTLTFANNKTSYIVGETVTYTYICTPGGTAANVTVQVVNPSGVPTTYNSATNVSQNTLGFGTSNLAVGTYTLRACFDSNCSPVTASLPFSVVSSSSTDVTLPGVVSNLAYYSADSDTVTLQWTAPGDDGTSGTVSGYDIRYSTTYPSSYSSIENWFNSAIATTNINFDPVILSPAGSIQKATVKGLSSGTNYYFGLKVRDEAYNWSPVSNWANATTTGGTTMGVPNAPTNLTAITILYNQVTLSWTDNSSNEQGFRVYRKLTTDSNWPTTYFSVGANVYNYTDTAVMPLTGYNYKVAAYNADGVIESGAIIVSTPASGTQTGIPNAPTNLQFYLTTSNQVNLNWYDNSSNEDGFKIFRKRAEDAWTSIHYAVVPVNILTYVDTAAEPGKSYYYKVAAYNASGISSESNLVYVMIPNSGGDYPNPPSALRQEPTPTGSSGIALRWDDNANNETKFNIYRRIVGSTEYLFLIQLLGSNIVSYFDGSVSAGIYYDYAVEACREGYGCSSNRAELIHVAFGVDVSGGSIYGKVSTSSGQAVLNARVELRSASSAAFFMYANSGADGGYRLDGVPFGGYSLLAFPPYDRSDLFSSSAQSVNVSDGTPLLRDLQLSGASKTIRGSVKRTDGRTIIDAGVGAWRLDGPGNASAVTDANGNYSLSVFGGRWNVGVRPMSASADWSYNKEPQTVEFLFDSSVETKTVNFEVSSTDAWISGSIKNADGSVLPAGVVNNIGFFNPTTRTGAGGQIDVSGNFKVGIQAGIYEVYINFSDATLYAQPIASVSVAQGENKNIGIILVLKKSGEIIRGRVSGPSGEAIVGAEVHAFMTDGGGFVSARTTSDGNYELRVFPGNWNVSLLSSSLGAYTFAGAARPGVVQAGQVIIMDFVLTKAEAVILGTVVNSSGTVLSDFFGSFSVRPQEGYGSNSLFYGGPVGRGLFNIGVPPGNYLVTVYSGYSSAYPSSVDVAVSVARGETAKVSIVVVKSSTVLQGTVKTAGGTAVTGIKIWVFANKDTNTWREALVDASTGKFIMNLYPGTWNVGMRTEGSSYMIPPPSILNLVEGQTLTHDFIVSAADAFIGGKITDPSGKSVANLLVSADNRSFTQAGTVLPGEIRSFHAFSDSVGNYKIAVPSGTYYIHVFLGGTSDYQAPDEKSAVVAQGETKNIDLVLVTAGATLQGRVTEGGIGRPAFVWAWKEAGGTANIRANTDGSYLLRLGVGRWKVGAGFERDGILFKAAEIPLDVVSEGTYNASLVLVEVNIAVPEVVVNSSDALVDQIIKNDQGVQVNIPANAMATQGSVTVTLTPTADAASQGINNVIGLAYEIAALDNNDQKVNSLNVPITITLPYNEKTIGIDENSLELAFWDEASGSWQDVAGFFADTTNNVVTGSTTHLTRFALVAPADITPPTSPTSIRAKVETGKITLSWRNPTSDFHSARIYRSLIAGDKGVKIADNIISLSWSDSAVQNGVKYYYNVKAVDLAGNESSSLAQTYVVGGELTTGIIGPYPSGTLFRLVNSPTVWYVEGGQRRAVPSPAVFDARFDWKNVKTVSDSDHTNLYTEGSAVGFPDGMLVKGNAPTVYVIAEGKKLPIASAEAFNGLGYKRGNIKTVSEGELAVHATGPVVSSAATYPTGSLIQKEGESTVWYVDRGLKRGFPTLDVFQVRKFSFNNVIKVSSSVLDSIPSGAPLSYPDYTLVKGDAPEVYFVEGEKRRHISSAEAFNANQYDWGAIRTVPDSVLNILPKGSQVG